MYHKSEISPDEPIIFDGNEPAVNPPEGMGKGFSGRDFDAYPLGSLAKKADSAVIPRSEWDHIILSMEKAKTRPSDYANFLNVECLNQGSTNYSWASAPIYCVMFARAASGLRNITLSTASVGATVKHFKNEPGCIIEAIEHIFEFGAVSNENWPQNEIEMSYNVASNISSFRGTRVVDWYDLAPGNFDQLMTHLLKRIPVAVGYNWWSHAVVAADPVAFGDGKYGIRVRSSWGNNYGDNGYIILTENQASPDEAIAIGSPTANFDQFGV